MPRMTQRAGKLTRAGIEKLAPESRPYRFRDLGADGLVLCVHPSGRKSFRVRYVGPKGAGETALGMFPEMALETARLEAAAVRVAATRAGVDPVVAKREAKKAEKRRRDLTFGNVIDAYMTDARRRLREGSVTRMESSLKLHIRPALGKTPLDEITAADAEKLINKIHDSSGPGAARTAFSLLKAIVAWAVKPPRRMLPSDPLLGYSGPGVPERDRVATIDELRTVWQAATELEKNPQARSTGQAIKLLMLTLQRRGEVCGMAKKEIEGANWTLPGERTKNKKTHVVPLSSTALAIVKEAFEHTGGDYAFIGRKRTAASTGHQITRAFGRICTDYGLSDLRVHDLRRTGATMLAELKVSGDVLSRLLNHTPPGPLVTKVYNRFDYADEKRAALELWAAKVAEIVKEKPKKAKKGNVGARAQVA